MQQYLKRDLTPAKSTPTRKTYQGAATSPPQIQVRLVGPSALRENRPDLVLFLMMAVYRLIRLILRNPISQVSAQVVQAILTEICPERWVFRSLVIE